MKELEGKREITFWVDGSYGAVEGAYFVRNDLKVFINKLIKEGHEPIGIKLDLDSFNLEIIVKNND